MDVLSPEQRSRNMAAIRGKHTTPELVVRRVLSSLGYRYRLRGRLLPGKPDIVFASRRAAILVHGCFWHRHTCANGRVMPKTRRAFWKAKLEGNANRDKAGLRALRKAGWRVLVVWECETRDAARLSRRLERFLEKR